MITFVGSKTFWHAATSAQTCALTDLVGETGATAVLEEGDLVLVNVVHGSTADRQQADLTPAGFTPAHGDLYADDDFDMNLQVSYKLMGGPADASLSIPASDSADSGVAVAIFAFRGVDPSSPLDLGVTTAVGSNSGVVDPPATTPLSPGAWIVACGGSASADAVDFTNPGGDLSAATNHFRSVLAEAATRAASAIGIKIDWSSGEFDPSTWGGSSAAAESSWAAATLALRPAPEPGKIKVWDGGQWLEKPVKVWDGLAFVQKPLKTWNGSEWVAA